MSCHRMKRRYRWTNRAIYQILQGTMSSAVWFEDLYPLVKYPKVEQHWCQVYTAIWCELYSPFGHIPGPVARFAAVIEHLSHLATIASGHLAIDTHVEILTILWVGVARVLLGFCRRHLGARELEHIWKGNSGSQNWNTSGKEIPGHKSWTHLKRKFHYRKLEHIWNGKSGQNLVQVALRGWRTLVMRPRRIC